MFKQYYYLTKPGIIYGNLLPAIAGFLFGSKTGFNFYLFFAMLLGLALVIASACVFNNIYDSEIDAKMSRTKNRAVPLGKIKKSSAAIFGVVLIILGSFTLLKFATVYAFFAALFGFATYVFMYTPLKTKTVYATLIGAIPGAMPPVVGFSAVQNSFGLESLILFFILVCWQMPHFYAIGIFRFKDYKQASIPIWPVSRGIKQTKPHILAWTILFLAACGLLKFFAGAGWFYFISVSLLSVYWIYKAGQGFTTQDDVKWAKQMFFLSLLVLLELCAIISIDSLIAQVK